MAQQSQLFGGKSSNPYSYRHTFEKCGLLEYVVMNRKPNSTSATGAPPVIPLELSEVCPDRHTKFLTFYSEPGSTQWNIYRSACKAGFSKQTAAKQGRSILVTALRRELRQQEAAGAPTMAEKAGFSREEIIDELRKIIRQDKDYRTKLKAIERMVGEYGITVATTPTTTQNVFQSPVQIVITPPTEADSPDSGHPLPDNLLRLDPKWRDDNMA